MQQMKSLKNDVDLLWALRRVPEPGWEIGNLDEFFQTKSAPALSDGDGIRLGIKSDLFAWLEDFSQPKSEVPPTGCIVLDGAVIIQFLKLATAKSFNEYAQQVFVPHSLSKLHSPSHATGPGVGPLHYRLVDEYSQTAKHEKGVRRRVVSSGT